MILPPSPSLGYPPCGTIDTARRPTHQRRRRWPAGHYLVAPSKGLSQQVALPHQALEVTTMLALRWRTPEPARRTPEVTTHGDLRKKTSPLPLERHLHFKQYKRIYWGSVWDPLYRTNIRVCGLTKQMFHRVVVFTSLRGTRLKLTNASFWSRNGAPSRKGGAVNGHTTINKANNHYSCVRTPPPLCL